LLYTELAFRRLARATARQIEDYLVSGYSVLGVIGVDGSPSCGVHTTLDFERSAELAAGLDLDAINVDQMNTLVRQGLTDGSGLFTSALQRELRRRHRELHYSAHDLIGELNGETARVEALLSP
jgi:hypothetical protein